MMLANYFLYLVEEKLLESERSQRLKCSVCICRLFTRGVLACLCKRGL